MLIRANSKYVNKYLPELILLLDTGIGEQALWIIESIQANCKFYNYGISCSPPIQTQSIQEKVLFQVNVKEVKIFENVKEYYENPQDTI